MELSNDLVSQFVKMTNDNTKVQNEVTVYGTVVNSDNQNFVKIDGSELLTPVSTTTNITDGERVTVMIKDHVAVITGNISAPAARDNDVKDVVNQISEFEIVVADTVYAQNGKIDNITADNVIIKDKLTATDAEIETLVSDNVIIKDKLTVKDAEIANLTATKLNAETANLTFATIDNLNATNIEVNTVKGNFANFSQLTSDNLTAIDADIQNLESNKLSTQQAAITYANIDFSNIGMAAVEKLFADSGIIKNLVVGEANITGELVGVTIKGDLIEANTLVADKLVVKGDDGLYYKLNTDGMKVDAEQTDRNSLNGSIITAKSITATKVNVDDLVAFDATIGGFKITDNSIYSGVKSSVDNTTIGVYLDNTGQINFGDSVNFIKFFKDVDNTWKLAISANKMILSSSNKDVEEVINDIGNKVNKTVKTIVTYYTISDSATAVPTSGWTTTSPTWVDGKYIWSKNLTTYTDNATSETNPVCITGGKGSTGSTGAEGQGIQSITSEYYLSTSKTAQTGGSWVTTPPTWSTGKYMWTRSKIIYKNPTSTAYTTAICDSSWEAVNEIEVGGRNLIIGSDWSSISGWNMTPTIQMVNDRTINNNTSAYIFANSETTGTYSYKQISIDVYNKLYNVGDILTYSVYMYIPVGTIFDGSIEIGLIEYDSVASKTTWNKAKGIELADINDVNNQGKWIRVTNTIKVQESTTKLYPRANLYKNGEVYFSSMKVEKGNIATDWSPAPEDIEISIANTYSTKAELTTAEDRIIGNVDTTLTGYVANSTFEQKTNEVVASFKSTGGLNLIRNSTGINGTASWGITPGRILNTLTNQTIGSASSRFLFIDNGTNATEAVATSSRFRLKPLTKYTLNGWFHSYTKCPSFDVWCLSSTELDDSSTITYPSSGSFTNSHPLLTTQQTNGVWKKYSVSFTTPANTKSGYIRIDNNGYNSAGTNTNAVHWNCLMLNEGEELPWTPHASEIYDGSTLMDATGLTIKNGAIKVQNNDGGTVLKGDNNGNLALGGSGTSGSLNILNSSDSVIGVMDKNGISLKDGVFKVNSSGYWDSQGGSAYTETSVQGAGLVLTKVAADGQRSTSSVTLDQGGRMSIDNYNVMMIGGLDVMKVVNLYDSLSVVGSINAHNSIISSGTFNRGGWSTPTVGALTQILDASNNQHSVIVGKTPNGVRKYGLDMYDTDTGVGAFRMQSGGYFLELSTNGLHQIYGILRIDRLASRSGDNFYIGVSGNNRIEPNSTGIRIYTSVPGAADTGFKIDTDGSCKVLSSNVVRHAFNSTGTKTGGSMDVDGTVYGMSPTDSPQTLIEYVEYDVTVNGEVKISLDSIYSKMISKYAVFPSNSDIKIIKKEVDGFTVSGNGLCDFVIKGQRRDADEYYRIMGGFNHGTTEDSSI